MVCNDASKANYAIAAKVLHQMDAEIGSEQNYERLAIADVAERKTIICRCAHENNIPCTKARVFSCEKCRKEVSLTANTFYHKVRLFRPRIVIMRWQEMGLVISANQATELLDISNHTANLIYKQLGIAAHTQMTDKAISVPSSLCSAVVCRRSTETPAREHPVAEELPFQEGTKVGDEKLTLTHMFDDLSLSEKEKTIFELLSQSPISFDQLMSKSSLDTPTLTSIVVMLELKGLVQNLPGNKYAWAMPLIPTSLTQNDKNPSNKEELIAKSFCYFIKDFFQGISRKNLQIYASLHWISFDRKHWIKNSLRKLCARHMHISYEDILAYATPALVRFVPVTDTA